MVYEKILCPYCKSDKVVRYWKNGTGKQGMMCQNPKCCHKTFQLEYSNNASKPETKEKIIDMTMNGSEKESINIGMNFWNCFPNFISVQFIFFFQKRGNSQSCDRNFYKYILFAFDSSTILWHYPNFRLSDIHIIISCVK